MSQLIIETQNLRKSFGELDVLKGINFGLKPSEVHCFIGSSGSGKSTLLRCLNFLEKPNDGTVLFHQKIITPDTKSILNLRQKVGMVFQHFHLFPHLTVIENIIEAPIRVKKVAHREAVSEARVLLQKIGLSEKENEYPARLSGGQKQRVAIARSLAMKPEVLLFDEPTSALDPENVESVLSLIKQLAVEGMTMVIVTHEMSFAKAVGHKISFLSDGEILETGSPTELFENPKEKRTQDFLSSIL